jgi:SAM-dependent methyltransferase
MRALARTLWRGVLARTPPHLAERVFRSWVNVIAESLEPAEALRALFALDDDVQRELDRVSLRYDGGVHAKHRLTAYHDFFVARVAPGERVLDLGCGKGELAYDLAERAGAVVTGVDRNRRSLDFARVRFRHPRLTFVEGDVSSWRAEDRFDVVVLSNVLEHLDDRPALLRRLVVQAQPRRLLLRVPALDRHWHVPLRQELGLPHFSDPTHEIEYTRAALEDELRSAGLEPVDIAQRWGELWVEAQPGRDGA